MNLTNDLERLLGTLQISYPQRGFVSTAPAARWEDGTIIGNGTQGALCFAQPHHEEIILSHESLFLPIYPRHAYFDLPSHLDAFRQLILENRGDEAMRRTIDLARQAGYIERELTDPFIGACALNLDMEASDCSAYARSTDFRTGGSIVAWADAGGLCHRRAFASRACGVIAVELARPDGKPVSASVRLARIDRDLDEAFYEKVVADTEISVAEDCLGFSVKFRKMSEDQRLRGYCVAMRVVASGGAKSVSNDRLNIEAADRIVLLAEVQPDFVDAPADFEGLRARLEAITPDYDALLSEHAKIHAELFDHVSLRLGEDTKQVIATEQLQSGSRVGRTDPALVQKVFDAGRFGTICSTGVLPPALQGIWTGTWRPRWSGDFTLNGNVQSAVAAALPGNYAQCMRATLDYLTGLMEDFRINARELFGFRGIFVPWRSSTHGQCHYAGVGRGDGSRAFPGMYWFAGTAWWAWFYYDYWLHTGDEEFFAKQLAPYFLESAAFYEDYLSVERDGRLVLVPSYSPENTPTGGHCLQPNATMTIASMRQLFRTLLRIGDRLGVNDKRKNRWREILAKLPDYRIDPSGALAEWAWPAVRNNEAHRHASHLYPLYDEVAPEIEQSQALREACRVAIEKRLEYRRAKNGAEMAFGLTQLGMAASYLRDPRLAYECVEWMTNSYWSPAMVSQHDPGNILNLDISGGLPAVVMNMLIQSFEPQETGGPYRIVLLPCLPKQWASGSLEGVRCRGGFEVCLRWSEHHVSQVKVTSLRSEPCMVEFDGRREELALEKGATWCTGAV